MVTFDLTDNQCEFLTADLWVNQDFGDVPVNLVQLCLGPCMMGVSFTALAVLLWLIATQTKSIITAPAPIADSVIPGRAATPVTIKATLGAKYPNPTTPAPSHALSYVNSSLIFLWPGLSIKWDISVAVVLIVQNVSGNLTESHQHHITKKYRYRYIDIDTQPR